MRDITSANFGLLIAYILPGFLILLSLTQATHVFDAWILPGNPETPTIGGFFYGTLASVAFGLTGSTVCWILIDAIHHLTGIKQPPWDFRNLGETVAAFDRLVDMHYRYYQFYGGTLVGLIGGYILRIWSHGLHMPELVLVACFCVLFFLGSRDTLSKYYQRVERLLGTTGACAA